LSYTSAQRFDIVMHLIKDSKETVITFNLLERIGETHPCQSSLLYDSRCRGVTDCLCWIAIADIVLPIILRQATNGPDRCLDRLIVHAFTGTSDGRELLAMLKNAWLN